MTPQPLVDLELVAAARGRLERALELVATIETAGRELDELVNDPDDPVAKLELVTPEPALEPAPPGPARTFDGERHHDGPAEPEPGGRPKRPGKVSIQPEDIPEAIRSAIRRIGPAAPTRLCRVGLELGQNSVTWRRVVEEMRAMAERGELVEAGSSRGRPVYDLAVPDNRDPDLRDEPPAVEPDDGDEPGPFPELEEPDADDAIAPRRPGRISDHAGRAPLTPEPGQMPSSAGLFSGNHPEHQPAPGLSSRTAKSIQRAEVEAAEAAANSVRNGRSPAAERILESMLHGDGAGTTTELALRLDLPRRDVAAAIAELEDDETAGLCRAGRRNGNIVYTAVD